MEDFNTSFIEGLFNSLHRHAFSYVLFSNRPTAGFPGHYGNFLATGVPSLREVDKAIHTRLI